jgi:hypothetical protein
VFASVKDAARSLAGLFIENLRKYQSGAGAQVKAASPVV